MAVIDPDRFRSDEVGSTNCHASKSNCRKIVNGMRRYPESMIWWLLASWFEKIKKRPDVENTFWVR